MSGGPTDAAPAPAGHEAELGLDWGEAGGPAGGAGPEPLLERAEVADLLRPGGAGRPGILAVVNTDDITYERLPMLEVVFDRLQRLLTASLRNLTSGTVDLSLEGITAQRLADHLETIPRPTLIAVFRAIEWDNYALLTVDRPLAHAVVDLLLGGRRGGAAVAAPSRPYTSIETTLVERLVRIVLADLAQAFAPVAPVQFVLERIETDPRFAAVTRAGNACVLVKLRVALDERAGTLAFLLPYATLEPVREVLLQMFMGEKLGRDTIWEQHLAREIWFTRVELEAVLDEQTVPLGQVLGLRVGSVLPLSARPDSPVLLRCGGVPLLKGRPGRVGDRVSIRVEDRVTREEER